MRPTATASSPRLRWQYPPIFARVYISWARISKVRMRTIRSKYCRFSSAESVDRDPVDLCFLDYTVRDFSHTAHLPLSVLGHWDFESLCGRNSWSFVLMPCFITPTRFGSPLSIDSAESFACSNVACGGIGGISGSTETSSTVGLYADRASSHAASRSSGLRSVAAPSPMLGANSTDETSARLCDSMNC